MPDITIPVPEDRIAEFYEYFGRWLKGDLPNVGAIPEATLKPSGAEETQIPWGVDVEQDADDAETLWRKLSPNARRVFGHLIDNPETEFTGAELAAATNTPNGAHGVAGVLGHPGRYFTKLNRKFPMAPRLDPETGEGYYFLPADRAELFRAARAKVEGA